MTVWRQSERGEIEMVWTLGKRMLKTELPGKEEKEVREEIYGYC